jgi:transposase InsO family protein
MPAARAVHLHRYTERLAEIGAAPSVGSVGDSYDNSLAEATIGLFKTELIRRHGPWRTLEEVELATLAYVDWYNHRRLHGQGEFGLLVGVGPAGRVGRSSRRSLRPR